MEIVEPSAVIETPLAGLHKGARATMGTWFGCVLPDHWIEPRAEQEFARKSVALIDKNYRAYLSFTGPDRVRYLNAILTNNIKELSAGQGSVSLLLNPQGHILAEIETYALADSLLCISYAMIREKLIEWLDKYIIMDDVTLSDESQRFGTLALEDQTQRLSPKGLRESNFLGSRSLVGWRPQSRQFPAGSLSAPRAELQATNFWPSESRWRIYGRFYRKALRNMAVVR